MLTNLKIGTRLALGFGLILALLLGVAGIGLNRMGAIDSSMEMIVTHYSAQARMAQDLADQVLTTSREMRTVLLLNSTADQQTAQEVLAKARTAYDETSKKLEASQWSQHGKDLFAEIEAAKAKARATNNQVMALARAGKNQEAVKVMLGEARDNEQAWQDAITKSIQFYNQNTEGKYVEAQAAYSSALLFMIAGTVLALILGGLMAFLTTRTITIPLHQSVDMMKEMAKGHLGMRLRMDRADEIGDLSKAMDGFSDHLLDIVGGLQEISKGDLKREWTAADAQDEIVPALRQVRANLLALVADVAMLSEAAIEGRLDTRADDTQHQGDFRRIVQGVNETLNSLVGFLDDMPAPAMIINKDFQILYMNKAGASLGNTTGDQLVRTKQRCYDFFRTSDCKTDKCACAAAMRNNAQNTSETDAHPGSCNLDIHYTGVPIRNRSGQVIGALEIVMDQTAVKQAMRLSEKIANYQRTEIGRVNANLGKIAAGNTEIDLSLADADNDTQETRAQFAIISEALGRSATAIKALVEDAAMLAQAGVEGKLKTRADATRHLGEFRSVIQGVNDTLDAVIGPLNIAADHMDRIGKGEVPSKITASYNGDFNAIKNSINACIDGLQGLVEANNVIQRMAANDFTAQVTGHYQGVFEDMGRATNETISQLRETLLQVQESAQAISTASGEISMGNQDLSRRTEEQAASLEETASSMEQITSNVNQTADNARAANQEAGKARKVAQEGGEAVTQVISAMEAINQSSARINEIIGVVDEIAFQTNLLALNAAVEAARAGEQGRGFAVVATEVRNLAKRSADAAKEIKGLIRDSVAKSQDGTRVAAHAGETIQEVVVNVQRVTSLVGEIAGATQEQSTGLNEINKAVVQMDEVTQQNAALVEEAAAAAESLDAQAHTLAEIVARFKTGVEVRRAQPKPVRAVVQAVPIPRKASPAATLKRPAARLELGTLKQPVPTPKDDDDGQWESF